MEWTDKAQEALWTRWCETEHMDDVERCLAIASRAVELAAARGRTMTALERALGWLQYVTEVPVDERVAVGDAARAEVSALGARNAVLEGLNKAAGEEIARLKQEVERLDAALSQMEGFRNEIANERDTLSERLVETNQRAQENWDRQEAERERLEAAVQAFKSEAERARAAEESAFEIAEQYRRQLESIRERAEQAEERVRQLAIAGQGLSAAVREHVGAPSDVAPGSTFTEKGTTRYPCSPACTHDDAALPGHAGVIGDGVWSPDAPHREIMEAMTKAAEAMRAACWEAVQEYLYRSGLSASSPALVEHLKTAIEGATP